MQNWQLVPTWGGAQIEVHAGGVDIEIELDRNGQLLGICAEREK
jgi:hypothetical protein